MHDLLSLEMRLAKSEGQKRLPMHYRERCEQVCICVRPRGVVKVDCEILEQLYRFVSIKSVQKSMQATFVKADSSILLPVSCQTRSLVNPTSGNLTK